MRLTGSVLALLAAVSCLTACGGDDGGGGSGGLTDALDSVSAGAATERYFAWSDMAGIREATGLPDDPTAEDMSSPDMRRWQGPIGTGASFIAPGGFALEEAIGLDLFAADRSIQLGLGMEGSALRLDGVDGAAVAGGVREAGATETEADGRDVLDFGRVDLGSDDPAVLVPFMRMPLVSAQDETVALASDAAALTDVLGEGDDALGGDAAYAAAADCLGDVLSATISPASGIGVTGVRLVATGVRGGDAPVEVLCAVGDEGQVDAAAESLRAGLAPDARDMVTNQTMDQLFTSAEIETGGDGDDRWAQAVITPLDERPLELVTRALAQRSVASWLGG